MKKTDKIIGRVLACMLLIVFYGCESSGLDERFAHSLLDNAVGNTFYWSERSVFMMDEANLPSYEHDRLLEEEGYISMELVDSSHCCLTFEMDLLEKANPYIQEKRAINSDDIILYSFTYDTLIIDEIIEHEEYYEVQYTIHNIHETPFIGPFDKMKGMEGKIEKGVRYVCEVRENSWAVDDSPNFYGM